jgi:hypothetical protein
MKLHYTKFKHFFTEEEWTTLQKDIKYIKSKKGPKRFIGHHYFDWGIKNLKSFKYKNATQVLNDIFPWEESQTGVSYYLKLNSELARRQQLSEENGNN